MIIGVRIRVGKPLGKVVSKCDFAMMICGLGELIKDRATYESSKSDDE